MSVLRQYLPNTIEYKGRRYRVNLAFNTVLNVFALQRDELFDTTESVMLSLRLLVGRRCNNLSTTEQSELYSAIFRQMIYTNAPSQPSIERTLDFEQDAPLIYGAFYQIYGIDLHKHFNKLDWRIFMCLFQCLPSNTRIKEVISIRRRPIPDVTKYNQASVLELIEAKRLVALDITEEERESTFQASVDQFVEKLERRARVSSGESSDNQN